MEYTTLRGTGLTVSRCCLGTMMFGGQIDEKDGVGIVRYAIENGINFIDTADMYQQGASEVITGKGIKGYRDEVILATKVYFPMGTGVNDKGLNRNHIIKGAEDSLKRLDTDYIDIYYLHQPDYNTPLEETLEAASSLVRSGKVRYVGMSNYASWQLVDALWISDKKNGIPPVVSENIYNMLTRGIEQELVPCLKDHNMGLVIYNPLAAGLLTGKHKPGAPQADTRFAANSVYMDRFWKEENFKAVEKLTALAAENGMTLLELAMRWLMSQKSVDSVILGMSKLSQLKMNLSYVDGKLLSEEVLAVCDNIWEELDGNRCRYNR